MCGIAGIFDTKGHRPVDRAALAAMTAAIAHRGPDGDGFHVAPGVGLGHLRLAIVDLAGGVQPMFNEDGQVAITFNGEIYNFHDLTDELKALGHRFKTHSDTEVIVHAWEEWGPGCLSRLRGMFAFAIWDARSETLFLARDRMGEKPLHYTVLPDGTLLFGSEIKALFAHPGVSTALDPRMVDLFFSYGYVPEPQSIYRDIRKLPAAHYLQIRRGQALPSPTAYWNVSYRANPTITEGEAGEALIELLRDAVRGQMIADVPLGAFLSGGVDSSGVVAMMAGISPESVNTFSISFGKTAVDESPYARAMAERYNTRHHVRDVDPDAFDLVEELAGIYDEPFGDSSALPTLRLCAPTREKVTVALSGDGGDEVFAGYRRYAAHTLEEGVRARLPQAVRGPLLGALAAVYPKMDWAPQWLRAKTTLEELSLDPVRGYFSSISVANDRMRDGLFSATLKRDLAGEHPSALVGRYMRESGSDDPLDQVQYADLKTYLPGDILTKVDRAAMACSLETRVPILDHRIVEWAATLPPRFRLQGAERKRILKQALRPYVSDDILFRPKQGFSMPLRQWFQGPLHDRLRAAITDPAMADTGFFDIGFLTALLDQHRSGRRDHAAVLWLLLCFSSFLRRRASGRTGAPESTRSRISRYGGFESQLRLAPAA